MKGLSPMITVVILIVITISVSAILAFWAEQYISSKTKNATQSDLRLSDCLNVDFSVSGKKSTSGKMIIVVESSSNKEIYGLAPLLLEDDKGDVIKVTNNMTNPPLNITIKRGDIMTYALPDNLSEVLEGETWKITAKPLSCPGIKRFGYLKG